MENNALVDSAVFRMASSSSSAAPLLLVSVSVALALLVIVMMYIIKILVKSNRVRRKLRMQGITGPAAPSLLYGNLPEMHKIQSRSLARAPPAAASITHGYTSTLFPYLEHWRKEYGRVYTYSTGMRQHLFVNEPELVKEMNLSKSLDLGKPCYVTRRLAPMLGNGVIRSNGVTWAQQRKILAPSLYTDKVKGMMGLMVESVEPMLSKWEECIQAQGSETADIRVDKDLREVSADVIARACFGSSYSKGKQIFSKLRTLQKTISDQSILFGVAAATTSRSYLPIFGKKKQCQTVGSLEKEIESLVWEAVKERDQEASSQKDLMQYILEAALTDKTLPSQSAKRFIVDNCKSIYFAGHESTAVAASWCLVLLALHPEWQLQIRTELAQLCKDGFPYQDPAAVLHLKTVTMVIHETLRLYPPAAFVSREALEETRIGNITVPKGVCLWTLIPSLHRDPEIWGPDANEFMPNRFIDGVTGACKFPHAYIPFGVGLRLCLGKSFAMLQLKLVLSLIISKFTFSLSPKYQHSPAYRMIIEPEHGVHLLVQKI